MGKGLKQVKASKEEERRRQHQKCGLGRTPVQLVPLLVKRLSAGPTLGVRPEPWRGVPCLLPLLPAYTEASPHPRTHTR